MDQTTITGALAGAGFRFDCNLPELVGYAEQHLRPLIGATQAPVVRTTLRWHDGQPDARLRSEAERLRMDRIDRDLYLAPDELRWFRVDDLRDLYLRARWCDDQLEVEADFYFRLGNTPLTDRLRRLRQWSSRELLRRRRFPTLLAYLVYYPCWFWLERQRSLHPIHAAGVNLREGSVLLAGASGIGKSTLSVALALSSGAQMLSDSFVLHHDTSILPVREPILLDEPSRKWLGDRAAALLPVEHPYGLKRHGYGLAPGRWADAGEVSLLVFPRRCAEGYTRSLSAEGAHQRLSAADLMINDLRRYWAFAAVFEQLVPSGLVAQREAQLAELTRRVPCYEFGVSQEMSCDDTVTMLLGLLADRPRRVAGTGS
ncbi:MAG: hypothetical protein HY270_04920 [Deltaproteobacteria bacterium]|nr:hypothetical protein [Deltaproteobacteria bacterium]